ncbi:uridine kinase [Natranaerovirga hydrolytica]|uniref:Uridine kinase n=1 Tax=Natranaerovirga hydrolytica TaxID=680378 RepID=A0A4R1MZE3_9FIRM|nr:nucleoside kinase [Natranaerovirga hydrolytica]TCK98708.1 uridine kinase [Natranaerovirga hydrolytica]
MDTTIKVTINGEVKTIKKGTPITEIAKDYQENYEGIIVLALVNKQLKELFKTLKKDCELEFITTADQDGMRTYKRSVSFLLIKSVFDVLGRDQVEKVVLHFSLSKGFYCEVEYERDLTQEDLDKVKGRMLELVKMDLPIQKRTAKLEEALELFEKNKMYDKVKLFKYRRTSNVNLYKLDDMEDYYYAYMVPSTGCLDKFDLHQYDKGFVLQFPTIEEPNTVAPFNPQNKLFKVLKETTDWGKRLNVDTVGALNDRISEGGMNELILISEALQEKRIAEIADDIIKQGKKIVLIAGPSSSGKTTFSHRLSVQLRVHGVKPHPIAVDNYFVNRDQTPRDENGEIDFESLYSIDLETFNKDMKALIEGKEVHMPKYNFQAGKREYKNNYLQIGEEDILIIEGIHGLNEKLTYSLPKESKFKIYISALTQLNVDEHNRVSTTDGRLIRRMVRDNQYRGMPAKDTLAMWASVRRGEEKNIFPFQEEADVMFNSALIYELAILKQYAEPLLFGIEKGTKEYIEAKRLIKFLDYFIGVSGEAVPMNSIIREFIGGSSFNTH